MPVVKTSEIKKFQKTVLDFYKESGRHDLIWRKTKDPYKILVSEIMLQQTQVERVLPFYTRFLAMFPTVSNLAQAPLGDVLRAWQGLGYNRRAKMLHAAAKQIVLELKGKVPKSEVELEKLPGIGPYTARAVAAFSGNADVVCVETNIRTAVFHHFFQGQEKVSDGEISEVLTKALPKGNAREWYWALMDYGNFLKRSGVRVNAKSKHHIKQSTFAGSSREARGAILKALAIKPETEKALSSLLGIKRVPQMKEQIAALMKEGMLIRVREKLTLP
jgi:A/G-specific adenine glycosylase